MAPESLGNISEYRRDPTCPAHLARTFTSQMLQSKYTAQRNSPQNVPKAVHGYLVLLTESLMYKRELKSLHLKMYNSGSTISLFAQCSPRTLTEASTSFRLEQTLEQSQIY
jgi:hypothetical protein